ncbi:putrescine aminotransferase [Anoxybacter fermentans]|uniref:Putrescine aminotransferase n=1 Tax=Anoxybacter fermentans TaxID=1323375 RepID=A0A3S9T061_9FIRM|nr:aspartate aminotransferase family protein [Anoxybacter fermentans]AZR73907.1 putrescine aminotransferase [Anoxybacter fermentans]
MKPELIDFTDGIQKIKKKEVRKLYKEYLNPGLGFLKGLLGFDRNFVRAEGVKVWDDNGEEYLDFLGAYGALNFGHNPPRILEMVKEVMGRPNLLQASVNPLECIAAHNLAQITPGNLKRTFFCNSGAEAVEGAIKLARAATAKTKIISCEGSFHGKTLGALTATGREKYRAPFKPLIPEFVQIPFGDTDALEIELKKGDVAAFIVEPIQGEGGIILPPPGYLRKVREICDQYEVLLIVDEVQTGFGRTGFNFAVEKDEVVPDIMCFAKSIGGGVMPVGAFHTSAEVWDKAYGGVEKCTLHTSTFSGNTLAMAAVIGAIKELVENDLAALAHKKGAYLLKGLKTLQEKYSLIKEVRGEGLMIGIEFAEAKGVLNTLTGGKVNQISKEYLGAMVAGELLNRHNIITAYTLNNPNVIRLEPPLVVSYEEMDRVLNGLEDIFSRKGSLLGMALASTGTMVKSIFKSK